MLSNMNETIVFDKAKWHFSGDFPKELKPYQAYIHTGFYIGWLIQKGFISDELKNESEKEINLFLEKKISSVEFYEDQLDGVFLSEDVNEIGLKFTRDYFDFNTGEYLKDYEEVLGANMPTLYHVKDTWENFNTISSLITNRYENWTKNR